MSSPTAATSAASYSDRPRLRGWSLASVIIALLLVLLLSALDQAIVGTALPKIIASLNGLDRFSWVGTAYLLTSATMIPIVGKLSDQFGRKWFLVAGVIIFLVGSALCGTSQTMNQLIAFRALQGVGAAATLSLTFTMVGDIFTPVERPKWQGVFATVFGISSVIGPLVGGYLTDNGPTFGTFVTDATRWRWVFYVNMPVGVIALVALFIWLPSNISIRTNTTRGLAVLRRIDWMGSILSAAATVALLLGLTFGGDGPNNSGFAWDSWQVLGLLIGSAALYILFVVNEYFAKEPIIPLSFFKNRVFAVAAVLSLLLGMVFLAVAFYLPTFIQGVLGLAATNSGLVIMPLTITLVLASIISGQMISRIGRYRWALIVGSGILVVGSLLLATMSPNVTVNTIIIYMLVIGLGLGFLLPVLTLAAQNAVTRSQLGVATGAVTYLRSLGSTLGIAIIGSVINGTFGSSLTTSLAQRNVTLPAGASSALTNEGVLQSALTTTQGHDQLYTQATNQAVHTAVSAATAQVPLGPAHDQTVSAVTAQVTAQVTSQVHTLLDTVLLAAKDALGTAIIHGFSVAMIVSVLLFAGSFFLKDIPLQGAKRATPATPAAAGEPGTPGEESEPMLPAGMAMH